MPSSFTGQQIQPITASPMFPEVQKAFSQWLGSQIGQQGPAYTGPLSPDMSKTSIPDAVSAVQKFLASGNNPKAGSDALAGVSTPLQNMIQYGTPATSPDQANLMEYGITSPNVPYAKDMAQFGQSGHSGDLLRNWASITPQQATQALTPFAYGAPPTSYHPPTIPIPGKGWV